MHKRVTVVWCAVAGLLALAATGGALAGTIDPGLQAILAQRSTGENVSVMVSLKDQVDVQALDAQLTLERATPQMRHERVVRALQEKAAATQTPFVDFLKALDAQGRIGHVQSFWISNSFRIEVPVGEVATLAQHPDVDIVYYNYEIEGIHPASAVSAPEGPRGERTPEIGVQAVNAPQVWALGFDGTGMLTSTLDTGVDGNHPALHNRWRGFADPRYAGHPTWAWFDPVTNTTFPTAFAAHGTHTMGTVLGGAPGDQIGVAPGAQWIHAAVIDRVDIPTTVADAKLAFQWLLDPDGDPNTNWDVPSVNSNSWGLRTDHGYPPCDQSFWSYIDACEAAGILLLFSAGNEGTQGPETNRRPADRATNAYNTTSIGAVDARNPSWPVADFSSRGPTHCTPNGSVAIKPELAAPGVEVRSSVPGGGYEFNGWDGTSMASPHVNGVAVLVREACPELGVNDVKQILFDTAHHLGSPGKNNDYGWGMVDALAAVQEALGQCTGAPRARDANLETAVNTPLSITLQATDYQPGPLPMVFKITTLPQGGNTVTDSGNGHVILASELPYSLINNGNQVLYTPATDYYGTDTFQFLASDGGTPPNGGDSNIATVSVLVKYGPPVITTTSLPDGLLNATYGPVQLQASAGQPPLSWEVLTAGQYYETNLGSSLFTQVGTAQNWRADDQFWQYTLPFAFPFYGVNYTTAYISSNGLIDFGSGTNEWQNSDAGLIAKIRIAALWDDIHTGGTGEDIFIDTTVPDQITVRWKGHMVNGGSLCNVSITLFSDGRIQFHYGAANTGLTPTIGLSAGDGVNYLLASYDNATSLTNANSLQFVRPATLPAGITLSTQGVLSGVPTESGSFQPTFRVTDSLNRSQERIVPLQVNVGPRPPVAHDQAFTTAPGANTDVALVADDDGLPNPPAAITYVILTLPSHARLIDPVAGPITSVPYTLVGGGHVVRYAASAYYLGPDSFTFKANDGGVAPDGGDSNIATVSITIASVAQAAFNFPLDTNPGWTTQGQWAFGHPIGGGSHAKDPANGHTGTNVYGYNLSGDYTSNLPKTNLTSTALDFSHINGAQLRFWRWLGVERFDRATVEVSNDGTNWTVLWTNPTDVSINDTAWSQQTFDISAVADHQATVYLRWGMGPTDGTTTYPGWNIDDIQIWGIVEPVPLIGDMNCDGVINFADINPFVLALTGQAAYEAAFPSCRWLNADVNGDSQVNFADINPFVAKLTQP